MRKTIKDYQKQIAKLKKDIATALDSANKFSEEVDRLTKQATMDGLHIRALEHDACEKERMIRDAGKENAFLKGEIDAYENALRIIYAKGETK